jgi:hypothetical protein
MTAPAIKEALDHKGNQMFTSYPTYSMAILWNLKAVELNAEQLFPWMPAIPVDGDALARSESKRHKNDAAWARLAADIEAARP